MEINSNSARDTIKIGRLMAKGLKPGDIICLFGQLGSGKTVFAKGLGMGLGLKQNRIISPSFVLLREYARARIPLYHFDFYRLISLRDIAQIGYEEYLYSEGVSLIEWADRLGKILPKEFLKIEFFLKPGSKRKIKLTAFGLRYSKLLGELRENIRH